MNVKPGKETTEFKALIGSVASIIVMALVFFGAIAQAEADMFTPFIVAVLGVLAASVPTVIGWIVTTYTNSRRDVKTSANVGNMPTGGVADGLTNLVVNGDAS